MTEVDRELPIRNRLQLQLHKNRPPPAPPPAGDIIRKMQVTSFIVTQSLRRGWGRFYKIAIKSLPISPLEDRGMGKVDFFRNDVKRVVCFLRM